MAISENPLLKGIRGSINKQIVVKQYAHRTVITIYPDMSRVVLSSLQKKNNGLFADAVKYARSILRDPEKLNAYKKAIGPGKRVYNHAIKEYLQAAKAGIQKPFNTEDEAIQKPFNTEDEAIQKPFNTEDERRRRTIKHKISRSRSSLSLETWQKIHPVFNAGSFRLPNFTVNLFGPKQRVGLWEIVPH